MTDPHAIQPTDATEARELAYAVEGISCGHCRTAITEEVTRVDGVATVEVDLDRKRVTVRGRDLDDAAVRAAIDEAGYDATSA